jgi:hypothetical protein
MKICKICCDKDRCLSTIYNCPHFRKIKYGIKIFEGPLWYSHNTWNYEYQDSFIKIIKAFWHCIRQYMDESTWSKGDKIIIYKLKKKNKKRKIIFSFKFPFSIGNPLVFLIEHIKEKRLKHFYIFGYLVVFGEKPDLMKYQAGSIV